MSNNVAGHVSCNHLGYIGTILYMLQLQICVMKHKLLGRLHSETCSMACVMQNVCPCKHPLTLLHSEQPKLYGVLAVLSANGLNYHKLLTLYDKYISMAAVLWYHPVLVPLNILHIPLCLPLKHPLKNRTRK